MLKVLPRDTSWENIQPDQQPPPCIGARTGGNLERRTQVKEPMLWSKSAGDA